MMYELRNSGHNGRDLQSRLDCLCIEIDELTSSISSILADKSAYIEKEKEEQGVIELENQIAEIEQMRRQFLDSFEFAENQKERQRLHRESWLRERGML
jgi:hypothetical protein